MADTGIVDLDSDLVGLGRSNLDILDREVLAGLPGHGGLAGDGLSRVPQSQLSSSPLFTVRGYGGARREGACSHLSSSSSHCV